MSKVSRVVTVFSNRKHQQQYKELMSVIKESIKVRDPEGTLIEKYLDQNDIYPEVVEAVNKYFGAQLIEPRH